MSEDQQVIAKGNRFLHRRVLDTQAFDGKTKQMYEVTSFRYGQVYYRPVYDYGSRQELGKAEHCSTEYFSTIAEELS